MDYSMVMAFYMYTTMKIHAYSPQYVLFFNTHKI